VFALLFGVVLALVVLVERTDRRPPLLVRMLEWRPLVLIGVVSYGVFLWHGPIIISLEEHGVTFSGRAGLFANLAIVGCATLLLSIATYRFVEAPSLRRRGRSRRPDAERMAAAAESAAP
jgi:peptidoglycan/LPS O-acetylase OafA/YrhL